MERLQRIQVDTIGQSQDTIRGWCWRAKSCPWGMAWGCVMSGASKSGWGSAFLSGLKSLRPKQDFLLAASSGEPLSYCAMLGHFRRALWTHGGLSRDEASMFSLHSCKCTLLSRANQLLLDEATRAKQGHHALPAMSKAVPKYGLTTSWGKSNANVRCWLPSTQAGSLVHP